MVAKLAWACAYSMLHAFAAAEVPSNSIDRLPNHGGVYVVAHRGAHDGIPENTLAAYRKAIELGCDFVEIDVRTTKDGKLVSVHNDTVDAYCVDGTTGRIRDFTLAQLRSLDIGSRVGEEWAGERIPTLDEILATCKGKIGVYLDLKDGDVEDILPVIRVHGMERDVLWYAGPRQLDRVADACPECVPMPDPGLEKRLPQLIERHRPSVIAAVWRHFSPTFVETCHANGAYVIVDEDTPDCWADALAWGADGIQTDHPEALIAFLNEHGASTR